MKLSSGKMDKAILPGRSHEELESLVLMFQGKIQELKKQNLEKDIEIANLREINRMRLLEKYKPSSEQMGSLFDELELNDLAQHFTTNVTCPLFFAYLTLYSSKYLP